MRVRVFLPSRVLADREADKVLAEAENGAFVLLPRHVDFVASLVPGLLSVTVEEEEEYFALDGGVLVKQGDDVMISTGNAVRGGDLDELERTVEEQFRRLDERERRAKASLSRLEADFVRRFLELEDHAS